MAISMRILRKSFYWICIPLCFLSFAFMFVVSPGQFDWGYRLPNGYEISRCNSMDISLIEDLDGDGSGSIIIDSHIKFFCYNNTYVGIKRIPIDRDHYSNNIDSFDSDNFSEDMMEYFLLDTATKQIYGPYSQDKYTEQCELLHIGSMGEWIDTDTKPSGEDHEKHIY